MAATESILQYRMRIYSPRPVLRLVLLFAVLFCPILGSANDLSLTGQWILNEDLSDDIEDALEDKLRRGKKGETARDYGRGSGGGRRLPHEVSQDSYWSIVEKSRERRSMRNLARLGTAYPMLTISAIEIKNQGDNYQFNYDGILPRVVRPNPAGRAYSAKGDELVVDSLGHTLSYWEKADLVLETQMPDGGKFIERLKLSGQPVRLNYSITLKMIVLKETVVINRVFDRAAP